MHRTYECLKNDDHLSRSCVKKTLDTLKGWFGIQKAKKSDLKNESCFSTPSSCAFTRRLDCEVIVLEGASSYSS